MKAAEAILAWTPMELACRSGDAAWKRTAGAVAVARRCDAVQLGDYALLEPVCGSGQEPLEPADLVARVFKLFNTLVLEHSIAPLTAHVAFFDLDEYRENLSPALVDPCLSRRASATVIKLADFAPRHQSCGALAWVTDPA